MKIQTIIAASSIAILTACGAGQAPIASSADCRIEAATAMAVFEIHNTGGNPFQMYLQNFGRKDIEARADFILEIMDMAGKPQGRQNTYVKLTHVDHTINLGETDSSIRRNAAKSTQIFDYFRDRCYMRGAYKDDPKYKK